MNKLSGVAGPQIVRGRFFPKLIWEHCDSKNIFVVYLDIVNMNNNIQVEILNKLGHFEKFSKTQHIIVCFYQINTI